MAFNGNHSDTSNTQIHDRPLSWNVTITAIPLAHTVIVTTQESERHVFVC
jgi:hypothetical protein